MHFVFIKHELFALRFIPFTVPSSSVPALPSDHSCGCMFVCVCVCVAIALPLSSASQIVLDTLTVRKSCFFRCATEETFPFTIFFLIQFLLVLLKNAIHSMDRMVGSVDESLCVSDLKYLYLDCGGQWVDAWTAKIIAFTTLNGEAEVEAHQMAIKLIYSPLMLDLQLTKNRWWNRAVLPLLSQSIPYLIPSLDSYGQNIFNKSHSNDSNDYQSGNGTTVVRLHIFSAVYSILFNCMRHAGCHSPSFRLFSKITADGHTIQSDPSASIVRFASKFSKFISTRFRRLCWSPNSTLVFSFSSDKCPLSCSIVQLNSNNSVG